VPLGVGALALDSGTTKDTTSDTTSLKEGEKPSKKAKREESVVRDGMKAGSVLSVRETRDISCKSKSIAPTGPRTSSASILVGLQVVAKVSLRRIGSVAKLGS
jgi:hypothetical protein